MVRVGIYARVSTDAQEARGTIGSQLEALRARVAADGLELVDEYVDDGVSGARLDRPGLDALRDAAEAGLIEELWCLTPDRLSRSYAYQVLITDELARHGVSIRYLDAPDVATDPQARLLTQVQAVIAEYERAKITERSRRGKLFRARAGEAVCWRAPYGYLRVPRSGERPAHLIINEEQAAVVRGIFDDYVAGGRSIRQITCRLNDHGIPSAAGGRWATGTVGRLLRRDVYAGRLYLNRTKMEPRPGQRGRQVKRPREEWILVPCPAIIDDATFDAAARACAENTNFSARRLDPNEEGWLLRGLVVCACGARRAVDRGRGGANGTRIRYYECLYRDPVQGGPKRRCQEGNIRADALDEFVFDQLRAALTTPELLLAGEHALLARTPAPDDELLAAQLDRLERRLEATEAERRRLADLYQAGVLDLTETQRRGRELAERQRRATAQRDTLLAQRRELATDNRLRHRVHDFAARVSDAIHELDFAQRQRLVRLLVDHVQVRGWHVDIHLRIPLDEPTTPTPDPDPPRPRRGTRRLSSEDRLRRLGHGAGPGVGAVRAPVGPVAFDERAGKQHGSAVGVDRLQAVVHDGGDAGDAAVVEALPVGAECAVDEDAIAGGVAALPDSPGGSGQLGAVDVAGDA
jgi:site-specific DNA recombinase